MEKRNVHVQMKDPDGANFIYNVPVENEISDVNLYKIGNEIKDKNINSKNIIIQFEVFNEISRTWMCIMSYYGNEDRVVKH